LALVIADTLARTVTSPYRFASRRHDRSCRRAPFHLPASPENCMSSALRHPLLRRRLARTPRSSLERRAGQLRLRAESSSQAPLFTLEAMSFQAKPGELVAILGPNASGNIHAPQNSSPVRSRHFPAEFFLMGRNALSSGQDARTAYRSCPAGEPPAFPLARLGICHAGTHPYGGGLRFESEEDILIANNALAQSAPPNSPTAGWKNLGGEASSA